MCRYWAIVENIGLTLVRFYVFYGGGIRRPSQVEVRGYGSQWLRRLTTSIMLTSLLLVARKQEIKAVGSAELKPHSQLWLSEGSYHFSMPARHSEGNSHFSCRPVPTCIVHSAEHKQT